MGIGTSLGAYFDDEFHHAAAQWDDKYDDNVIAPNTMYTNRALDKAELDPTTGLGIEVVNKELAREPSTNIEDRRGDIPTWDMNRLMDPHPITDSIGGTNSTGVFSSADSVPDPWFPSALAKGLGINDADAVTLSGLMKHLGIQPIEELKTFKEELPRK